MIIDTSAILAILQDEPERQSFNDAIEEAEACLMSTATFVEASMVLGNRFGYDGVRDFDLFLARAGIELVPVDIEHARIARQAFQDYGKGRSPAGLNFGDCFSYALARATGLPLLFKGNDFSKTDIEAASLRTTTSH